MTTPIACTSFDTSQARLGTGNGCVVVLPLPPHRVYGKVMYLCMQFHQIRTGTACWETRIAKYIMLGGSATGRLKMNKTTLCAIQW